MLLPSQANFRHDNDLKRTRAVGSYPPNKLGLYDMHGNVSEWTHNPQPVKDDDGNPKRNERGGGWTNDDHECRVNRSFSRSPSERFMDTGLRVELVRVTVKSAVAEKGVLDFAEIHDADEPRFDAWIAQMKKDGLRAVSLSVQTVNESPRYTAVAIKEQNPKLWGFNRGPANDEKHTDEFWDKGYLAIAMSLYRDKGGYQDANLWVHNPSFRMAGVWWGPRNAIAKHTASAAKQKNRPFGRSAIVFNGATNYALTLGDAANQPWTESIDLPLGACKAWLEKHKADGWRPEHLYAYGDGAKPLFGGILIKESQQPDWDVSWSLTPKEYEAEIDKRRANGFRPQTAVPHESDDGALGFSVIWVRYRSAAPEASGTK